MKYISVSFKNYSTSLFFNSHWLFYPVESSFTECCRVHLHYMLIRIIEEHFTLIKGCKLPWWLFFCIKSYSSDLKSFCISNTLLSAESGLLSGVHFSVCSHSCHGARYFGSIQSWKEKAGWFLKLQNHVVWLFQRYYKCLDLLGGGDRNKAPIEEKSALFKCLESKLLMFIFLEVGLKCHL